MFEGNTRGPDQKNRRDAVTRYALMKTQRRVLTSESRRLFVQKRQPDREARPDLRCAVHFDRAAVIFDNFFRDVESEARSALSLFGCEIWLENLVHLRRRNSVASIFHAHIDVEIFLRAGNFHGLAAIGGGLHTIRDYVLNSAENLYRIAHQRARVVADFTRQLDAALRGE